MLVLAILQAAVAGPMIDPPRRPAPLPAACGTKDAEGTVIVCGRSVQDGFRLKPLPDRYDPDAPALPRAQTSILGGRAALAAETEAASVGGVPSNRAMVRLKIPLGRKP